MTIDSSADALRDLLGIVDIDASATIAVLGLAQRELPRALAICAGDLIKARFRLAETWRFVLAHCAARLNTRSVNRQALRKQGVAAGLIDGFIGDSARPQYAGESDPFIDALRIDLGEVSALVNPQNQGCLLTAPDHFLIDRLLPEVELPDASRTPPSRPRFLRLSAPSDLPDFVDGSALQSLELGCVQLDALPKLLASAQDLRHLRIHHTGWLGSGIFDGLAMHALERLDLPDAAGLTVDHCSRIRDWHGIRALCIHGLGMAHSNFDVLTALSGAPFWTQLVELDLLMYTSGKTLDSVRWEELWADREFALESLQLRFIESSQWRAVWRARMPRLRGLTMAGNDLRDQLASTFDGASLPHLELLDLRDNNLSPQAVRDFAQSHRFPGLRRIGIKLNSEVMEDYFDWNGAVVGRGPIPLTASEIEATWLAGTGLRVFDG